MQKRIEDIKRQETFLNKGTELVNRMEALLQEWKEYQPEFRKLMDYYQSPQWMEDFRDSNEGMFEDFPCGVLSQDAVYDLYSEQRTLNFEMIRVGLSYLED